MVLNHKKLQFELWLMGQNADVQRKYLEILKNSAWNHDRKEMPKYSVLEIALENHIDFNDKENMTRNIISRSISLSLEIEEYIKSTD